MEGSESETFSNWDVAAIRAGLYCRRDLGSGSGMAVSGKGRRGVTGIVSCTTGASDAVTGTADVDAANTWSSRGLFATRRDKG